MTQEVNKIIETIYASDKYKEFHENYPDYYLAHCFAQLDKDGNESKQWQIGFYSPEKDNLATFVVNPAVKRGEFEDAFKEGGVISRLHFENIIEAKQAIDIVHELINKEYKGELVNSFIIIIQTVDEKAVYNITAITMAFAMITIKIDATDGKILDHKKRSILDLRKEDE